MSLSFLTKQLEQAERDGSYIKSPISQLPSPMGSRPGQKILFIVGFPRSGTKLLRRILNNHPDVFIASELLFLPYLLDNWDRYGDLSDIGNFRTMYGDVTRTLYFKVREKEGIPLFSVQEWYAACETFDPTGVLASLIRHETEAPSGDGIWLGDKSPNYTTHLDQIKGGLPDAKIIHIVRDVRDAALSARKIWGKNMYRYAQQWADGMRVLHKDFELIRHEDRLELRYEDLLSEPLENVARITEFLGLEFYESMISLDKPSENFGDAKSTVGILSGNTGKYRTQLTEKQRQIIEPICSEVLRRYGYDVQAGPMHRRLSVSRMTWYMILDILNRMRFDLRIGRGFGFVARSMVWRSRTRI